MSADNWAICPRCKINHANTTAKMIEKVNKQYGKIDQDQFVRDRQVAIDFAGQKLQPTLREDYEIYTDSDGVFTVSYGCSCSVCNFRHEFNHEERLKK